VTDPKGEKPESDHPHEDDFPLELHPDQEGPPAVGDDLPSADLSLSGSIEDFHFAGPAEELDFTEPADFIFPTEQPAEGASEQSGELAAAEPAGVEGFFGAEGLGGEASAAESPLPEDATVGHELGGEGTADLESAEEAKPKPKFQLPGWVRTVEWVMVGLLAAGAPAAIIASIFWVADAKQVTLTLNVACPLMLGLIPYALWRSSARWVTPAASALYTVMLALSAAALIAGAWLVGLEVSRYDWQYSKARVKAGLPPRVVIVPPEKAEVAEVPEPPPKEPEPAPAKDTAEPAPSKGPAGPAPAKGSGEVAPPKSTVEPAAKP
jgi:hypothetical protein